MNKSQSLSATLPKLVLAAGIMMAGAYTEAYASPTPEPQQAEQSVKEIKGTVIDSEGEPLIGATVQVKGTKVAQATDIDGNFVIKTSEANPVLQISYVGCKAAEVAVKGKSTINVTLEPSSESLDEVVVTALGIKRQAKALGYSVQDVKGDALTEARENNMLNSLSGRVAGLQVSTSGSGSMGSSRIIIRGNNSLSGNNQPLIVVDGVPIANGNGGSSLKEWGGTDSGNGLNDISPDDIESISVLKGPAAAALYGTRAGNGVLMITTKKSGGKKGWGITFNSNVMIETPLTTPKLQNIYGQGSDGEYVGNNNLSWGPKMDGREIEDWTGQVRPFKAYNNDIMDYLQTGVTTTNTLEAGFSGEQGSFRGSFSYQRIDGVVPQNYRDRFNMNIRGSINFTKNISLDTKVNYIKTKTWNLPALGNGEASIMRDYLIMPRSVHFSDMAAGFDENGNVLRWNDDNTAVLNPYAAEVNKSLSNRDRLIGFIQLNWQIMPWLSLKLRHGEDMYWDGSENCTSSKFPVGSYVGHGRYQVSMSKRRERNTDALITASQDNLWGSKLSASVSVGGNLMHVHSEKMDEDSGALEVPDFFRTKNGLLITSTNSASNRAINSIYGLASLNWGNWLFVDITGRNDWSSTLPHANRSFFYPSIGGGLVINDMLADFKVAVPRWITFAKLRASWAEVGNDTDPYSLETTYGIWHFYDNLIGSQASEVMPLKDLKPEKVRSTELGFDFRVLDNRLGLDFTYYKKNATNQILRLPTSKTTGYSSKLINAGNVQNEGLEFVINATPVRTKDFQWTTTLNYTRNRNKIIELHEELHTYVIGKNAFAKILAPEGGRYGDISTKRFIRNEEGKIIVDKNGLPLMGKLGDDDDNPTGNYLPDWQASWNNVFTYKGFSLSFLLDFRKGGDIYMNSVARSTQAGTSILTVAGRDAWETYKNGGTPGGILVDGVVKNDDGTYSPNTTYISPQAYWTQVNGVGDLFVYDGTNLRLRELTVGYTVPQKILAKSPLTGCKLSFVARNLWMIYSKGPDGFDPESTVSTGNAGGIEHYSLPSMRNFGFNLNISF